MSKAGPLTKTVSKRMRPSEVFADNNHHADAVHAPSNAQASQPHASLGHRFHSDEIIIGLALGSPRQSPILALSPDDRDVDSSCLDGLPENATSTLDNVSEIGSGGKGFKRKGSKWRSLGSFFGRNQIRPASPFYQLDPEHQPEPGKQLIAQNHSETNALRRKRADSNHGSKAHQADLYTGISGSESTGLLRRTSSRRRGLRRKKIEEHRPEMQRIPARYKPQAIDAEQQGSRMLGSSLLGTYISGCFLQGSILRLYAKFSGAEKLFTPSKISYLSYFSGSWPKKSDANCNISEEILSTSYQLEFTCISR